MGYLGDNPYSFPPLSESYKKKYIKTKIPKGAIKRNQNKTDLLISCNLLTPAVIIGIRKNIVKKIQRAKSP